MIAAFRTLSLFDVPVLEPLSPKSRLRRTALRGRPVALGTPDHPYEPSGRSPLTTLDGIEELEISVVTGSTRITDEIEILADLDRRCSVTVDLLVPAADPMLSWKLEAVSRLSSEGIAARVLCPLTEGMSEAVLRRLFSAAREAGAWDVRAHHTLARSRSEKSPALATFSRLRLEYGFPREMPGRG